MAFTSYKAFEEDSKASVRPYICRIILVGLPKLAIIVRTSSMFESAA